MSDVTPDTTMAPRLTPREMPEGPNLLPTVPPTTTIPSRTATVPSTSVPTTTVPSTSVPTTTVPIVDGGGERPLRDVANEARAILEGSSFSYQAGQQFDLGSTQYLQRPLGLEPASVAGTMQIPDEETGLPQALTVYQLEQELVSNPALQQFQNQMRLLNERVLPGQLSIAAPYTQPFGVITPTPNEIIDVSRGDKYATEADVFRYIGQMSINELASFKNKLVDLNLIRPEQRGLMEDKEVNDFVWNAALRLGEAANLSGYRYDAFLARSLDSGYKFTTPQTQGRTIPPVRLTARDDLAFTANQIASQRIGRELNDAEIDAFLTSYNDMERKFHSEYYAGGAVEISDAPTIQGATETMIQEELNTEAEMFQYGSYLDAFTNAIRGNMA